MESFFFSPFRPIHHLILRLLSPFRIDGSNSTSTFLGMDMDEPAPNLFFPFATPGLSRLSIISGILFNSYLL